MRDAHSAAASIVAERGDPERDGGPPASAPSGVADFGLARLDAAGGLSALTTAVTGSGAIGKLWSFSTAAHLLGERLYY